MRSENLKATLKTAVLVTTVLLLGVGLATAQQQINLTAGASNITLPDGSIVPMWGYSCGAAVTNSTATCGKLNPAAAGWSPVVITVPTGQDLQILLTNHLSFGTTPNNIPTSLVIVGQLGGGLGTTATSTASPDHSAAQGTVTWPIVGPGAGTPPTQGSRVQSFSTEVAAVPTTDTTTPATSLTWTAPRPGTYLLESGTHPSIQGTMGLYGIVVVTTAPTQASGVETASGTAYPGVSYDTEIPVLFSEIDPIQNNAVQAAVTTSGFSETMVWSGQPGGCGNPSSSTFHQCYPPTVNYTPLYYLINGVGFDKTQASNSLFAANPASTLAAGTAPRTVLVRMVNAGSRMHVPSIVGSQTGTATAPALPPGGFSLIAEDGNVLPGVPRVQSEVFMAAGKTYDVMINVPTSVTALPIFDRELSLSGNAIARDAGMLAYIGVNGASLPLAGAFAGAVANPDTYNSVILGQTLTVSDPGKGLIANDVNISGVKVVGTVPGLTLNLDGTFTYTGAPTTFTYCGNGATSGSACATVTLAAGALESAGGIQCNVPLPTYTSNVAKTLSIKPPGVLSFCTDAAGYPLTVASATATTSGLTISVDPNGGFNASVSGAGTYNFTFVPKNGQGTSGSAKTARLVFPAATGLAVTVLDGTDKTTHITDYRWIIEEDRTFYINPNCTTNVIPQPAGCPTTADNIVPTFGTNFHTSYMPVVATGCTGTLSCESGQSVLGQPAVCDQGNGVCRTTGAQQAISMPSDVHLDPTKRYYISVLPGDAANPVSGAADFGHGMGGAPIGAGQPSVIVLTQPTPFQPAKLSVFVFEDDFPLNGEQDSGGGIDILGTNEPGLGGFQITLFDDAGGSGDSTGQPTYDMFNMPLSNSLAGTIDPATHQDACPISAVALNGFDTSQDTTPYVTGQSATGITGMIVTCPRYEADGVTLSPLAGQAVVANLYPGRYGVVANAAADRIARGEEWLQTNTLDGQKAHDSFLRVGEPSYFQEFGPAGYHVSIGFANPKIINGRKAGVCGGTDQNLTGNNCVNTVTGSVTDERMSRTPDERLYSSGSNDSFSFTQCYVSLGDTDGEDFAFTKCNADGTFTLTGIPDGDWRVTVFDQWNDMLVDGLSTPVRLGSAGNTCPGTGSDATHCNMGEIAMNQWQANIYTRTFFDPNGLGVPQSDSQPGLALVPTNIRFRDGSYSNFNNTDLNGFAGFNEVFPLFSWYVVETDTTRYKSTGTHVVYDAGGPADGTCTSTSAPCGSSTIGRNMANTAEVVSLPTNLRVPGAVYCANADCTGKSIADGPTSSDPPSVCTTNSTTGVVTCGTQLSTGRIDPPWVSSEGWQGFSGQNSFIEFGKKPYAPGENGGIRGHVIYASTRPFDDPALLLQLSWEPMVPNVTINLYQEGTAPDGSQSLKLVDTTKTSSFDEWAQGFRSDLVPNMNCPGQGSDTGTDADLFFFTLFKQPMWLDFYNSQHAIPPGTPTALPNNAQFKCFDGMHNWNQVQPVPYDGMYSFPSVTGLDPATGKPTGTNCTICVQNPDSTDPYRFHQSMLPAGKYVVEVVVPPGYELVKEEDKNILIGDTYVAPVVQQFAGLGNIYILPDQAAVSATYNPNNPQNATTDLGAQPRHEGDTGSVETFWPCVGQARIVPDYISLFPQSLEVSPFAGATRNLCDRKEVTLDDQMSALAKFYVFTSTHVAAHFTGVITDDFTSEFDPFSPQFGEKFSPPNLPISIKDFAGNEVARTYTDQWGTFNGLNYSTWEVNPPNPTGYAPQMMVTCMNDPGSDSAHPDPLFNPEYSQFCYEIPFMPGQTQYMDTPVVPTSAFAGAGYNNPDCAYPDATPAISEVDGTGIGPYLSGPGTLTIKALGDQIVPNNAYSGPSASLAPFNAKTAPRHYGFGASQGTVTIGGRSVGISNWSDTQIQVSLATADVNALPVCAQSYRASMSSAQAATAFGHCGQLLITTATGKQSVDAVTVTVGGKAPIHVTPDSISNPTSAFGPIQSAIDAATPGDLIIVNPGVYNEMLLMWKPVRLQGVGAASSVINANSQPAGRMDPWRQRVNCLFGLAINGQPTSGTNKYDPTGTVPCGGWTGFNGGDQNPQVDRLPLEGVVGWDTTVNGNLAELLQEPSLMGAYEGAGITILAKGVRYPAGSADIFGTGSDSGTVPTESQMPLGTILLSNGVVNGHDDCTDYPSNFLCAPSSIDGLSITDSSQGGGGLFLHAWAHYLQISNNRVYNNTGTLTGGINVGQGESPDAILAGNNGDPVGFDQTPWTCNAIVRGAVVNGVAQVSPPGVTADTQLPFCYNINVNVHNNAITRNSSIGDELFSSTPAGAGGISFATGADRYSFTSNWVCGNMSTGDGGGVAHIGFNWNGDIEHNTIIFNQSTNPTIPTNGGGIAIMTTAPDGNTNGGLECGSVTDQDCAPGLGDGTGPGLNINANLIMGNSADSGSGGGLRLQGVNGAEITRFPTDPTQWYSVSVTNNIIANNVAGWDGAGISLLDTLNANIINNTLESNDTTASAGVLFDTLGAPLASSTGTNCTTSSTTSCPQPAGLVTIQNSSPLVASLPATIVCPVNHGVGGTGTGGRTNGLCRKQSVPLLANDVFWQNRSFYIGVGSLGTGGQNQQNVVSLFNAFTTNHAPSQPQTDAVTTSTNGGTIVSGGTGACPSGVSYWDIGVRGDTGPTGPSNHPGLAPSYSVITTLGDYASATLHNTSGDPAAISQYCNGSRWPPEFGSAGYQVPAGISDATVPNPIFSLTPAATVDEGNNWVNMSWGPLALTNTSNGTGNGSLLGNYGPATGTSSVVNLIPGSATANFNEAPNLDFYGTTRKTNNAVDAGAVEFTGSNTLPTLTSIVPNTGARGTSVAVTLTGTNLAGATSVNLSGTGVTATITGTPTATQVTANFTITTGAATTARTVSVTTGAGTSNTVIFNVTVPPAPTVTAVSPNTGVRGTNVAVTITGTNFTNTGTTVAVSGTNVGVTGVTVVNSTTITATFNIATGAGLGARNVRVTTPGGTSAINSGDTFTVTGATLTSVSPNTGVRGTAVSVTLTGAGLTGATNVTVSGSGVTVSGITAVNDTTVTATLTVSTTATVSNRNVAVVTPIGTTNNVTFTVQGPTLTAISPTSGLHGTTVPVTITGTNLGNATGVTMSGSGVTCTGVTASATSVSASCAITNGAALTTRSVTVNTTTTGSATLNNAFKVN